MTEKYRVVVEMVLDVELPNDSSSEKFIAEYAEKHIKKLLANNYEMAHNRNIRRVHIDYCNAELTQ